MTSRERPNGSIEHEEIERRESCPTRRPAQDLQSPKNLEDPDNELYVRPTDHSCSTCSKIDRLTGPACKVRSEPRPDLPAERGASPDLTCLQSMELDLTYQRGTDNPEP